MKIGIKINYVENGEEKEFIAENISSSKTKRLKQKYLTAHNNNYITLLQLITAYKVGDFIKRDSLQFVPSV